MTRLLLCAALLLSGATFAQDPAPQEPPEEDLSEKPKEYVLNPLQAEKEMKVANFYMKKGSYRAALRRFEEALKWDPNLADAWLRIAEVHAKRKDEAAAREALKKYLELRPDAKDAKDIRKRLAEKE